MKKIVRKKSGKAHNRRKQIKVDCECGMSRKAMYVSEKTRMLGTEPKVFRVASGGEGLPKWRRK